MTDHITSTPADGELLQRIASADPTWVLMYLEEHPWFDVPRIRELFDFAKAQATAMLATPSPGKAPEPVAWMLGGPNGSTTVYSRDRIEPNIKALAVTSGDDPDDYTATPLYVHPASPGKAEAERWIPVMESSPMQGEAVLVAVEFDGPGDWRIKCGSFTEERTWKVFGASWTPSHWMPLPAAPNSP